MEGRKKLTILLVASFCFQLITIDTSLGLTPNQKYNGLPTVRKRFVPYNFEGLRSGPPIGSYIYIMGHLNPDELEEHGLSVSTRSFPPNNINNIDHIDPKKQPPSVQPSGNPRPFGSSAGQGSSEVTPKFTGKNNKKTERSKEMMRKWMNFMKRMSNNAKGMKVDDGDDDDDQSPWKQSIDHDDDYDINDNDVVGDDDDDYRDLRIMFPKMNFLKFLHFPKNGSLDSASYDEIVDRTFKDINYGVGSDGENRHNGRHGDKRFIGSTNDDGEKNDFVFKYSDDKRRY